ncbi:hypothetical protein [Rhodococcus sp. IEGM 1408]|uniref:hypothetical protein n=1 Tax=Rhodococcus sp. IEGM 1408 TaxID=3082220 RepID=UPI002952A046|nr:hypothetical protein [Rhodococcus sp. IEGM 1408]MDV8000190.1 hypothetical protein [Rhodococcus sp. IEGM 1408]
MTDSSADSAADADADAVARFPGGRVDPADWTTLAGVAADHRGEVQLTPGGGVLIRRADGMSVGRSELVAAGLASRIADDRLPRILASPLAGRVGGHHDLADLPERLHAELVVRLDSAMIDSATLAGGLVVGFDAGSGDVLAHSPDLAVVARNGDEVRVHVSGRDTSVELRMADAVTVLADVTVDLVRAGNVGSGRQGSREVHDLVVVALGAHPLASPVGSTAGPVTAATAGPVTAGLTTAASTPTKLTTAVEVPRVGWVDTDDGLVSLLSVVPDGIVSARLAEFLGAVDRPGTISADRVIGLHALTEAMAEQVVRVLAPMGMIYDAASPWADGSA